MKSERGKIFKTQRNESKMKNRPQSKKYEKPCPPRLTPHNQVAFTTFRMPRMAALCGRVTPNNQIAFTTFRKPHLPPFADMTPNDQIAFTTFHKPRMAALCGRVTPNDQVAFTKFGGPLFGIN